MNRERQQKNVSFINNIIITIAISLPTLPSNKNVVKTKNIDIYI